MSRTLFVEYRNTCFWAYDVAVGILLKHMIDRASERIGREDVDWLSEVVERWRANATVSDLGLHLEETWSHEQVQVILGLVDEACDVLEKEETISSHEMEAWDILNGQGVFARGVSRFPTASVVELGRAIQALLRGILPVAPKGVWWFYGTESGRSTIKARQDG